MSFILICVYVLLTITFLAHFFIIVFILHIYFCYVCIHIYLFSIIHGLFIACILVKSLGLEVI